jgi:hypothetical protein
MRFMVIEHFRDADPVPIYRRFRERGRMLPEGVTYVASWIEAGFQRCFQVMECDDLAKLQQWLLNWNDLAEFEIVPVVTSQEAAKAVEPFLDRDT